MISAHTNILYKIYCIYKGRVPNHKNRAFKAIGFVDIEKTSYNYSAETGMNTWWWVSVSMIFRDKIKENYKNEKYTKYTNESNNKYKIYN